MPVTNDAFSAPHRCSKLGPVPPQYLAGFDERYGLSFDGAMAPKHHPVPLSGGDRKALTKELGKSRGMTVMLARQADEKRGRGEAR
jgi:hypothetical protein